MSVSLPPEIAGRVGAWKKSGYELYVVHFQMDEVQLPFVIRALTRQEYLSLVEELDPGVYYPVGSIGLKCWPPDYLVKHGTLHYRDVIQSAVLWPEISPDLPAGVDLFLARSVVAISGWDSRERFLELLGQARTEASTLWGFLESRVRSAFPSLRDDDIENMTLGELLQKAAMSEVITGVEIDHRPWTDPQGYMREVAQQEAKARRIMRQQAAAGQQPGMSRSEAQRLHLAQQAEATRSDIDPSSEGRKINFEEDNRRLARA